MYCVTRAPASEALARLAHRFSVLGIACVGVLIASGVVNSLFLVGSFAALFGTAYGQLLVVKLALFAVMLVIATVNRFALTPRLTADPGARRSLQRNAMAELTLGIIVVAIVGALGTMVPGAHQSPRWPFAFTLVFTLVNVSRAMLVALIGSVALALAALALLITSVQRNAMRLSIPGVIALLVVAVSTSIFAVPAFPTTYATSPVPYTVDAVARGAARFSQACTSCHGADARGDGPAAAALATKPINLAEHALHHPEGNLFWWIAHGITATPMPAFSPRITDKVDIWETVQYLVARGSAEAALALGPRVDNQSMSRAPDFTYEVAGQRQRTLAGERTPALLVLYSTSQSDARLSRLASDHRMMHANVRVIPIPLSGPRAAEDAPTTVSANVASVYAMFAVGTAQPAHVELLVDAAGTMRARWTGIPGGGSDRDAEILAAVRRLPASQMPATMHHGH